ncbi:MAG TPA: hypothetical protein VNJ53_04050 [Gaiellaceae bacterium]|nr:hypothetical protein [Gaiellaceae bacterium]
MPNVLTATLRRLQDERGLALPLALSVTVIVASLAAGIFTYVTTNQGAAYRARADQSAYGLAEAGVSYALSTLKNAPNPYSSTSVPQTTVTLPGGTVVYQGTLNGTTWTLTGTSTVRNPSGPGAVDVSRTASIQAEVRTVTVGDTRPYDYLFIDQPSGCFALNNTVTIEIPLYVRGNLCLNNNVQIQAPAVHVLGSVYVNNPQASIGTSASPIPDFSITGSCYYNNALTACTNSSVSRVWAGYYGSSPPVLTKPTIDLAYWYANADLGPASPCTTSTGSPPAFDNDSVRNVSRGDVDITPSSAYSCKKIVNGQTVAEISWTPGANPSSTGLLKVKGTIYFDGNLTWTNLSLIDYDGRATIYASGKLVIKNQADLCGVAACDNTWDPKTDFLAFVAGSMVSETAPTAPISGDIGNKVNFQGAIYCVNDYDQDNNTTVWGPVIARNATITNSGLFKQIPGGDFGDLLPGLPQDTTTETRVETIPGSYAG